MKWTARVQIGLHFLFFLVLILVLFGGYFVEFFLQHKPCALCYLQRLGMVLACLCLLINLKMGPSSQSLGVCLLSSLFGSLVALRHNSLKFCCSDAIKPIILGKSIPTWALYVFGASMLAVAVLLMFKEESHNKERRSRLFNIAFILLTIVLLIGIISSFLTRGFGF